MTTNSNMLGAVVEDLKSLVEWTKGLDDSNALIEKTVFALVKILMVSKALTFPQLAYELEQFDKYDSVASYLGVDPPEEEVEEEVNPAPPTSAPDPTGDGLGMFSPHAAGGPGRYDNVEVRDFSLT